MRIVLVAFGTRGDVQPAIALGRGLQAAGHAITLVAGTNFEDWVCSYGLNFVGTTDQEALMKSPEGIAWVEEPNPLKQLQHMKNLLQQNASALYEAIVEPAQRADLLISGFVSQPFTQAASEKLGIPQINMTLQPYHPTRSSAASFTPVVHGESIFNLWMGYFAQRLIWSVSGETTNAFRAQLGLPPHNVTSFRQASKRTPTIFGFSQYVVPPQSDWGENCFTAGYWFLDEHTEWQPPQVLSRFLDAGAPPIYFGFGSMSSGAPQKTLELIVAALHKTGLRGIIAKGWGGANSVDLPDAIHLIDHAPHEWLFQRVAGVVHHGGAGTTAAGLRAGAPAMIIPHMADQPYWGRRIHELGVGVKPIPRHKLSIDALAVGIETLVTDARMSAAAAQLGEKIRAENGVENGVRLIEQIAGLQSSLSSGALKS